MCIRKPNQLNQDRLIIARSFINSLPHARYMGMRIDEIGTGFAVMSLPYNAIVNGDITEESIHSIAISGLIDTCGGLSVLAHKLQPLETATMNLRVDYLRPAALNQEVRARAECYYISDSVAYVKATAEDNSLRDPIATALGTFAIIKERIIS